MATNTERRPHLLVPTSGVDRVFSREGRGDRTVRDVERRAHGQKIRSEADVALTSQDQSRAAAGLDELASLGCVITVEGGPDLTYRLKAESLESMSRHKVPRPRWLLLTVLPPESDQPERAAVWVADEFRAKFLALFDAFLDKDTPTGKPRNAELVANMTRIRATALADLWQSSGEPPAGRHWWELWLRDDEGASAHLEDYAERDQLRLASEHLRIGGRLVCWVEATWSDLLPLPFTKVPLVEIRRPQFVDTPVDLDDADQFELVDDLAARVTPAAALAPAVCLLDSGVRRTHSLLEPSLAASDVHSVVPPPDGDIRGHGTALAGLALYGPLTADLLSRGPVELRHRLESVKFMPDAHHPTHDPLKYGLVTARAIAAPEATSLRSRTFCLAVTSAADRPGEPSLWSASIDALAAGTGVSSSAAGIELLGVPDPMAARLVVVSAGNVQPPYEIGYRGKSDQSPHHDPAQAWNALTVGAHTEMSATPSDPTYDGWGALGAPGDLSPHSTTAVAASGTRWPAKPDICMEGGNVLTNGIDFVEHHQVLALTTTGHRSDLALDTTNATSAATAQASRLAAMAMAAYPAYWPETIKGLLVHSASWTPHMQAEIDALTSKTQRLALLRRFGWGVPTVESVLTSSDQAVTVVIQDTFIPFTGDAYAMRTFRLHDLPWPRQALLDLGAAGVELRITLSYFIEPNPARRGWRRRYSYASHGLRFELRGPNEGTEEFVRRVNREAASEEDDASGASPPSGPDDWTIGPNQRNKGSLHSDIWSTDAATLSGVGCVAVHAVGGWWKYNSRKDRTDLPVRYALLLSLRTQAEDVDLYAPIATEIGVPVESIAVEV